MSLQDEIDTHRREIHTDSYPMSIGELVNLYREKELDLHPEFQRFYRWTPEQKSRWIESILLGIPLPSIFVVQRHDGVWDVIDGLQRLSSILEVMGELRDETGKKKPMLPLERTKYLPSLDGKQWKGLSAKLSLSDEQQRYIKRAKLDIKIIQRESHEAAKYELFQRLNTGGSTLSEQEVRSCILISVNRDFYRWAADLAKSEDFQSCLPLTERQLNEQYDLELAIRFLVFRKLPEGKINSISELGDFLTEQSVALASDKKLDLDAEADAFATTFSALANSLESDAFRKYDKVKKGFTGAFLISAFEVVAMGIGAHYKSYKADSEDRIKELVIKQVWNKSDFLTSSGVRATQRLPKTIPFGRKTFAP